MDCDDLIAQSGLNSGNDSHSNFVGMTSSSTERKQQKLNMVCDDLIAQSGEKTKLVSLSAGGDAHVRPTWSAVPEVLVPDTPDSKTLSSKAKWTNLIQSTVDLHTALLSVNKRAIQTNVSLPLSTDLSASQATHLSANRHVVNTNLSSQLSLDQLSCLRLDKLLGTVPPSTDKVDKDSVQSPVPAHSVCFINKEKPCPQALQPIQVEQTKLKYGHAILRKPVATVSRRGNKENRSKFREVDPPITALNSPGATLSCPRKKHKSATFAARNETIGIGRKLSFDEPAPPRVVYQGSTASVPEHRRRTFSEELLDADSTATVTCINTMINGETRHFQLDPQSSPALLMDFPPPKEAVRIRWSDQLAEKPNASSMPVQAPVTPRSILQQRSADHKFPFSMDPPSPIVLTRRRLPKSASIVAIDK